MGYIVYILCAFTSLGCTILLMARYRKTGVSLLFWSAVAFLAFTSTNILLFVDLVVVRQLDLTLLRNSITLAGVMVLLYGLIHDHT